MISRKYQCPKCGADLEDFYDKQDPYTGIGPWDDDRFRCGGHLISPLPFPHASKWCSLNRTRSCGYFGLMDLGVKPNE